VIYISKYSSRLCCSFKSFWTLEEFYLGCVPQRNQYLYLNCDHRLCNPMPAECLPPHCGDCKIPVLTQSLWFPPEKGTHYCNPSSAHPPQFCFLKSVEETSENSRQTCTSDNTVGHSVIYDMQMCKNVPLGVQQLVTGIFFVPYLLINVHNSTQ